jgi:hypothetical protein
MRAPWSKPTFAITLGMLGVVGCALTFSPGDYANAPPRDEDAAGGTVDQVSGPAVDGAASDAASGPTIAHHLLVIAGERDTPDNLANDVWLAPLDAQGDVGPFALLQPGIFRGTISTTTIAGGRLFVAMRSTPRRVEHIGFDAGVTGTWQDTVAPMPPVTGYGNVFAGTSLLALGGGIGSVRDDGIQISSFDQDAGTFGELSASPTKLPVPMQSMQLVTYKDFIYVIGGDSKTADQSNKVYVARIDPVAGVSELAATTSIVDPATGQRHSPQSPILCAVEISSGHGRLIIAGGVNTDVVLTSAIDEATGMLGPWEAGANLPNPLRGAGCAFWNGSVHLIGGYVTTYRSDRILRASLSDDGKLGEWSLTPGEKLPGPRSSIVAYVY